MEKIIEDLTYEGIGETASAGSYDDGGPRSEKSREASISHDDPKSICNLSRSYIHNESSTKLLEKKLHHQENENQRYQDQVERLESEIKKQKTKLSKEQRENKENYGKLMGKYRHIVDTCVKPYGKKADHRWRDIDLESMDAILRPLVHDALEADELRVQKTALHTQVRKLQKDILQVDELRDQKDMLKEQVQKLQGEMLDKVNRAQLDELEEDKKELKSWVERLRLELLVANNGVTNNTVTDNTAEEVEQLQEQNKILNQQLRKHQEDMIARSKRMGAITDDQFLTLFRSLVGSVKSLGRSVRVTSHVNVVEVLGEINTMKIPPSYWNDRSQRKNMIEASIWSILSNLVFENPFVFFGKERNGLRDAWKKTFGAEHHHGWPSPTSRSEMWRGATVAQFVESAGERTILYGEQGPMPTELKATVIKIRTTVTRVIRHLIEHLSADPDTEKIQQVTDKAFELALQMITQPARVQVTYPTVGASFNTDDMTALPEYDSDDDDHLQNIVVGFVVNPGLAKWGNCYGEKLDIRYDIVPSLVKVESVKSKGEQLGEVEVEKGGDDNRSIKVGNGKRRCSPPVGK